MTRRAQCAQVLCAIFGVILYAVPLKSADVLTARNDNARTGQNNAETILSPQNVNAAQFGRLYSFAVDGYVYAQPLYKANVPIPNLGIRNVVIVATEHDSVYAFDAEGNNPDQGYFWKASFLNEAQGITTVGPQDVGTSDIKPEIGITGTPVIDGATNTVYFVTKTKHTNGADVRYVQELHALDLATGQEKMNGPVEIQASVAGSGNNSQNGQVAFDPRREHQRAALILLNGVVYIPWAAHGDQGIYHGWVIGYDAANIQRQVAAYCSTPSGWGGGIWMSGGGIAADAANNLYVISGNGDYDDRLSNYGESAIRLSTASGLTQTDSFTPNEQDRFNQGDLDMGVSNAVILPDQPGPFPHQLVTADKSGTIYLINRESMGGYNPTSDSNLQKVPVGSTIHNNLGYFNGTIYVGGDGGPIQAFAMQNGLINEAATSKSQNTYGVNTANASGASPTISSNGTGNAIVWALNNYGESAKPAVLYAYDATDLSKLLYSSDQAANGRDAAAPAVKFSSPTVADGKVFVGGVKAVTVYGLLGTGSTNVTADPVFDIPSNTIFTTPSSVTISTPTPGATIYYTTDGSVPDTSSNVYSEPIQVAGSITIKAIAVAPGFSSSKIVSAFYSVQDSSVSPVPVFTDGFNTTGLTFGGAAGIVDGRLRLTSAGVSDQAAGAFYTNPVPIARFTTEFQFQMIGDADGFTFTVQGEGPDALGSTGAGLGYGPEPTYHVSSSERSIGHSAAIKFDLYDNQGEGPSSTGLFTNGNTPMTPGLDTRVSGIDFHSGHVFKARIVYDGTTLGLAITDTSDPTKTFTTSWAVDLPSLVGDRVGYVGFTAGTGGLTATQDIISWSFTPNPSFTPNIASTGLTFNGGASVVESRLRLTDGGQYQARSAWYSTKVDASSFNADFTFQITNAVADGFTFAIQNSAEGTSAAGGTGGGLGYGPDATFLTGTGIGQSVALKFDLYDNGGEGGNSLGLFTNGQSPVLPAVDLGAAGIDLHNGHLYAVHLAYDGVTLNVTITDQNNPAAVYTGAYPVDIPGILGGKFGYVGFTGGTGELTTTSEILSFTYSNLLP